MVSLGRVKIHTGVIALILFAFFSGRDIELFLVFLAVTIHELSHMVVAYFFGGKVESIYITPVGQVAKISNFYSLLEWQRIIVLLCGPIVNVALGFLCGFFHNKFMIMFSDINMAIAIFNILPIPPLDGGNIVYNILGRKLGVIKTAKFMTYMEGIFGFMIILLGIVQVILYPFNISLIIIGGYFMFSKRREYLERVSEFYTYIIDRNRDYTLKPMVVKKLLFNGDYREVIKYFNYDDYFFVVERGEYGVNEVSMEEVIDIIA